MTLHVCQHPSYTCPPFGYTTINQLQSAGTEENGVCYNRMSESQWPFFKKTKSKEGRGGGRKVCDAHFRNKTKKLFPPHDVYSLVSPCQTRSNTVYSNYINGNRIGRFCHRTRCQPNGRPRCWPLRLHSVFGLSTATRFFCAEQECTGNHLFGYPFEFNSIYNLEWIFFKQ